MRSEAAGSAVLRNITPRGTRAPGSPRLLSEEPKVAARERPRGRGHWQPAGPTCLVRAVLVRVPAGPRRSPTQPRCHQGRRLIHARPAADGAAPSPAAAKAAGARAPALPPRRRQEAAEPVPFHGSRPGAPPRGALVDTARSARLRSAPLGSAPTGLGRSRSAVLGPLGSLGLGARPSSVLFGPESSSARPSCARSFPPDSADQLSSARWKLRWAEEGRGRDEKRGRGNGPEGATGRGVTGWGLLMKARDWARRAGRKGEKRGERWGGARRVTAGPARLVCRRRGVRASMVALTRSWQLREVSERSALWPPERGARHRG